MVRRGRWTRVASEALGLSAMPSEAIDAMRLEKLQRCVDHARENALNPAYGDLLRAHGLDSLRTLKGVEDLQHVPVIDKAFLREAGYAERPATHEKVITVETTGTTSSSVAVPHTTRSVAAGLGDSFLRALAMGGVTETDRHWTIGHWTPDIRNSGSRLSMAHLRRVLPGQVLLTKTSTDLERQASQGLRWDPDCISSSPAFLVRLARHLIEADITLRAGTVLYGGAAANPGDRDLWFRAFGANKCIAFYPTTDVGPIGVSPSDDGVYRAFTETHVVEVLDRDNRPVGEGQTGWVVVTALDATAAPLIRYRIGDLATYLGVQGNRVLLADIRRGAEAALGDTLLSLEEISSWGPTLSDLGYPVEALQLVRRAGANGLDQPVLRIAALERSAALECAASELLYRFPQAEHSVRADRTILEPIVEYVERESLTADGFKLIPYVDERAASAQGEDVPTQRRVA